MRTKIGFLLLVLLFFGVPSSVKGNPFHSSYVCLPRVNPNAGHIEFHIREGKNCVEGEQLARVVQQKDGSILLLPSGRPVSKKEEKEFDKFKKYYGVD